VVAAAALGASCCAVNGLYEDEAGLNDWHLKHVGKVQDVAFMGNRAVVVSEESVVAAIEKDGELAWREVLPTGFSAEVTSGGFAALAVQRKLVVTLSKDGCSLKAWEAQFGGLKWQKNLCAKSAEDNAMNIFLVEDLSKDNVEDVVVVGAWGISVHSGFNGDVVTTWSSPRDVVVKGVFPLKDGAALAYGVSKAGSLVAYEISLTGPTEKEEQRVLIEKVGESQVVAGSLLLVENLKTGKVATCDFASQKCTDSQVAASDGLSSVGDVSAPFVKIGDKIFSTVTKKLASVANVDAMSHVAAARIYGSESDAASQLVTLKQQQSAGQCGSVESVEWHDVASGNKHVVEFPEPLGRNGERGAIEQVKLQAAAVASTGGYSARIMVRFEDESIVLVQLRVPSTGAEVGTSVLYVREEALANVVQVGSVELSATVNDQYDQFAEQVANVFTQGNPVSIFLFRLQDQTRALRTQFVSLFSTVVDFAKRAIESRGEIFTSQQTQAYSGSALSAFGFRRGLLLQTKSGKVFLVNSVSGDIIYGVFDPKYRSSTSMFVTRSHSAGTSHPAEVVFVNTKTGYVTWRNALTGAVLSSKDTGKPIVEVVHVSSEQVHKALLESGHDSEHLDKEDVAPAGFLVVIDESLKWQTYPEEKQEWLVSHGSILNRLHAIHLDENVKSLTGYAFGKDGTASEMWSLVIPKDDQLLQVKSHVHGAVNNPGVIRSDLSLLVKYLNPNMLMFATLNPAGDLLVNVVDGVSGRILKRFSHKNCKGPVHSVLFDNTLIYSYWNVAARRNEVSVVGLFEGEINKRELNMWSSRDDDAVGAKRSFSSFDLEQPTVSQRTYFVENSIAAMGVTGSRLGISSRRVFFGLESGSINMQMSQFLDSRRPPTLTDADKVLGMTQYFPQLPIIATHTISYNLTVERINAIHSFPTKLESTTLVLSTGLDLFFARVMPSKGFDVLNEDFSYFLLVLMVAGLMLAMIVLNRLVKDRKLSTAWK